MFFVHLASDGSTGVATFFRHSDVVTYALSDALMLSGLPASVLWLEEDIALVEVDHLHHARAARAFAAGFLDEVCS